MIDFQLRVIRLKKESDEESDYDLVYVESKIEETGTGESKNDVEIVLSGLSHSSTVYLVPISIIFTL